MYHPERVTEWLNTGKSAPIYLEVGVTDSCNYRCTFCALDFLEKKGSFIDSDLMDRTLDEVGEYGVKAVMFAGEGEPLLHKDIGRFVQTARKTMDVSITTNGYALTEEKIGQVIPYLNWIRVSMDAGNPDTYAEVHGTSPHSFERVLDNLQNTVDFRNSQSLETKIGVQFLMLPQNRGEVLILARRLEEIGVDNLQVKPYSHHPQSLNDFSLEDHEPFRKELESFGGGLEILFRDNAVQRVGKEKGYSECHGQSFISLIDCKGNVLPCNLFYGRGIGNLHNNSFKEIWESKKKEVITSECRENCRLDTINRYLHRLKNPESQDNFI